MKHKEKKQVKIHDLEEAARDPKMWLFESRCQASVAKVLWEHFENKNVKYPVEELSGSLRASFFHAGIAIENAAKAVLISRNPSIVSDKSVKRKHFGMKSGHDLIDLTVQAVGELSDEEHNLLSKLEQFVMWRGKYSFPLQLSILENGELIQRLRSFSNSDIAIFNNLLSRISEAVESSVPE